MSNRLPVLHRAERFAVRLPVVVIAVIVWLVAARIWAAGLTPLTSFGGGDGWLAPGDRAYLTTDNTQRGLAYNPTTGHLLLVNRSGGLSINILDAASGDDVGALSQGTGIIAGGTFVGSALGVADDGAIYMANLVINSNPSLFKIYRWANETATEPTVAYVAGLDQPLPGARLGDSFDVIGSGNNTRLVAGYGNTPAVAGNNSYAVFETTDGLNYTATHIAIDSTPPNGGDFRLGITFNDSNHVLGAQGSSLYRYTSYSGSTGTLLASPTIPDPAGATADRLLDYTVLSGNPLLAVQSVGDAHVSVYSAADPAVPLWLGSGRNIVGSTVANGNGTGEITWGAATTNQDGSLSQTLYGMSTNSGIQAFTFTLAAPPTVAGDYDNSGSVDAADYVVWVKTLNRTAAPAGTGADGSGNGIVGPEDFDFWRARFGNPSAGSGSSLGAAVPEPGSTVLVVVGIMTSVSQRRRRANIS
jgi:hypothetical protein